MGNSEDKRMIALYARVSSQEQAREGYSIDEQVERLRLYCYAHGRRDVKPYVDAGFTGASTDRPALQSLIADVKSGRVKKVVVYKLDRLSRSQKDTLELIEDVFLANHCDFESMTERFDTGTSFGRAMIGILAVFAQLEREQIKERMSLGKSGRAKEGKYHGGGHSPLGYTYEDGELKINEDEAVIVREMFRIFRENRSLTGTAKRLTREGYTGRRGRIIDSKMVRLAITNNVYIGKIKHNGEVYDGQHEPLVSVEIFDDVNRILKAADETRQPPIINQTMLGGLIYCKKCGARYGYTHIDKDRKYRYYSCYSRRKISPAMVRDPNCKNKNYRVDVLDKFVLDQIRQIKVSKDDIDQALALREDTERQGPDPVEVAENELKRVDEQISRLLDLYSVGKYTIEQVVEKTDPLQERRAQLEQKIVELLEDRHEETPKMSREEAKQLINDFGDIVDNVDPVKYQELVRALIEKIEIDDDDIYIYWRF